MKRLIFIIAFFTATSVQAQFSGTIGNFFGSLLGTGGSSAVHYDSSLNMPYVQITPVRWQHNLHIANRLYAKIAWVNSDSTSAVVTWRVCWFGENGEKDCHIGMGNYDLGAVECGELKLNDDEWLFEWLCGGGTERLKLTIE